MSKGRAAAIIVAGGVGRRMGRPKQLLPLFSRPLLFHSIAAFARVQEITEIIVVTTRETMPHCGAEFPGAKIVESGETRLDSVRNGMRAVSAGAALVAVHDGARPLVSPELIAKCLSAASKYGAAVAAVPVKDTIKTAGRSGGFVANTPPRSSLWAAQTPQCYKKSVLARALGAADRDATDESQLVEKLGVKVRLVESSYENIKITTPDDLTVAEALMRAKGKHFEKPKFRVGMGYDIHRMVAGRPLIIGGVTIPHGKGLLGHSDGDVVLHAVCDAALGAIAAGEIGVYFPPTDLTIMGISSRVIAEKTLEVLKSRKARLSQLDVTLVAEEPKISPHYQTVRKALSEIFALDIDNISFKAKSAEGLGSIGKGNAMACHAIAVAEMR